MRKPLVSILIPNYNYGRYLNECLESVLRQTYDNIEVIISDNQSTDNSYDIMQKYKAKFKEKNIWCDVLQNKVNIGSGGNTAKCFERSVGEYFIWLSADDSLKENAIELMVQALTKYPSAGCAMAHRDEVDDEGNMIAKPSFYNQSCFIPGEEQASVYMMAGIAVSSQILFRRFSYLTMLNYKHLRFQVAGDWYDNFMMACVGDVVYIKQALINYRVHLGNETSDSERNLVGVLEHYQLINAFCTIANNFGMTKPQKRYGEAVNKLGYMCLRYTRKMILDKQYEVARKYMKLATIFCGGIECETEYIQLAQCLDKENPIDALMEITNSEVFERLKSYDPPENSIRIPELE